jgi:site-specific recombinase XerD
MRLFRPSYNTPDKTKKTARKWYLDFYYNGRRHKLPALVDKRQAAALGEKIEEVIGMQAGGMTPGPELQRWIDTLPPAILSKLVTWQIIPAQRAASAISLRDHLDSFKENLKNKGNTSEYSRKAFMRIQAVLAGCDMNVLSDVSASRVQKFLADEIQAKRMGRKTANHYIGAIKTFFRWLVQDGRGYTNPVEYISFLDTAQDDKRIRRPLTAEEMRKLLAVTAAGPVRQCIPGRDRAMHYETAAMTGLRAGELRALKVRDFDFGANVVRLAAKYTKNRREAVLPLKSGFAERLKIFLSGKLPDCLAFKTAAGGHENRVLRQDLAAAGILEVDAGKVFDFHSFRVFYASMLAEAGTSPKTAMELMRHSDIRLTMSIYSFVCRESLTTAISTLPDLSIVNTVQHQATGTDNVSENLSGSLSEGQHLNLSKSVHYRQLGNYQNGVKHQVQGNKPHFCDAKQEPDSTERNWRQGVTTPRTCADSI